MARRGGALAIAVGTGIGTAGAFAALPGARRPHLFLPDVSDLLALCAGRASMITDDYPAKNRG